MRTFEKQKFSEDFDYSTGIKSMMGEMGYSDVDVETCFSNGLSHYVRLKVDVLNEGKCYGEMFVYDGKTTITIRISDHHSGLERNCNGVSGNKMTMEAFKMLVQDGAIQAYN